MQKNKKGIFDRIALGIYVVFTLLLLIALVLPYTTSKILSPLVILSLGVPYLIAMHLVFVVYWMVRGKRYFLLSLLLLIVGYFFLGTFYKFNLSIVPIPKEDLSIMSYNVLGFDKYHRMAEERVNERIEDFVTEQDPDIIAFQEFDSRQLKRFIQYPHSAIFRTGKRVQQAIFSKYPIVSKGTLDFPDTWNNAVFADIAYKKDTIRIYNLHLQSFQVVPSRAFIEQEPSKKLLGRINRTFLKQQQQARIVAAHRESSPYKAILCGDFNNTQYSNTYKVVKGDLKDSFLEMGSGFGRTYNLRRLPFRIDFILGDASFGITSHRNYDVRFSDHYPVMATFRWVAP